MTLATDHLLTVRNLAPPRARAIQHALMWIVGVGSALVFIEPSPYELATLAALVFFYATGLRMRPVFLPLLIMLVMLNFGYTICSIELMDQSKIMNWIATSWYMAITAFLFALLLAEDTAARLDFLQRGLIIGGVIAAASGVAGYFHLVPGGDDLLTLYGRARGTFKDPNVLSAFLILPALLALQNIITASFFKSARNVLAFGIIALALLLAFSRAAWGQIVFTSVFMVALMYLTSRSHSQRSRIVLTAVAAIAALALMLAVLLSFDSIQGLFKERASLHQTYDSGRYGRFGRHVLGFEMAMDLPLGIGPLQFRNFFPEDTHNSFLNAFMSGGWLSGILFPALVFTTVAMGFRLIFVRVPWQRTYLAFFSAFLGTVGEAFIIDVDHWRHFWLMLGTMWGFSAATYEYKTRSMAARGDVPLSPP